MISVPKPLNYNPIANPETLGQKLWNRRHQLGLLQSDVARILGVTEDGYRFWEIGVSNPMVRYYPRIIKFLQYFPFDVDTSTFAGKCRYIRYINGLTGAELGEILKVHSTTVHAWEQGKHLPSRKMTNSVDKLFECCKF